MDFNTRSLVKKPFFSSFCKKNNFSKKFLSKDPIAFPRSKVINMSYHFGKKSFWDDLKKKLVKLGNLKWSI